MGADDPLAKDCVLCRSFGCRCIGHRIPDLDRQAVHLVGPGSREMGTVSFGRICSLALCLFRFIPTSGGLVDFWDGGRIHIWCMEGVRRSIWEFDIGHF